MSDTTGGFSYEKPQPVVPKLVLKKKPTRRGPVPKRTGQKPGRKIGHRIVASTLDNVQDRQSHALQGNVRELLLNRAFYEENDSAVDSLNAISDQNLLPDAESSVHVESAGDTVTSESNTMDALGSSSASIDRSDASTELFDEHPMPHDCARLAKRVKELIRVHLTSKAACFEPLPTLKLAAEMTKLPSAILRGDDRADAFDYVAVLVDWIVRFKNYSAAYQDMIGHPKVGTIVASLVEIRGSAVHANERAVKMSVELVSYVNILQSVCMTCWHLFRDVECLDLYEMLGLSYGHLSSTIAHAYMCRESLDDSVANCVSRALPKTVFMSCRTLPHLVTRISVDHASRVQRFTRSTHCTVPWSHFVYDICTPDAQVVSPASAPSDAHDNVRQVHLNARMVIDVRRAVFRGGKHNGAPQLGAFDLQHADNRYSVSTLEGSRHGVYMCDNGTRVETPGTQSLVARVSSMILADPLLRDSCAVFKPVLACLPELSACHPRVPSECEAVKLGTSPWSISRKRNLQELERSTHALVCYDPPRDMDKERYLPKPKRKCLAPTDPDLADIKGRVGSPMVDMVLSGLTNSVTLGAVCDTYSLDALQLSHGYFASVNEPSSKLDWAGINQVFPVESPIALPFESDLFPRVADSCDGDAYPTGPLAAQCSVLSLYTMSLLFGQGMLRDAADLSSDNVELQTIAEEYLEPVSFTFSSLGLSPCTYVVMSDNEYETMTASIVAGCASTKSWSPYMNRANPNAAPLVELCNRQSQQVCLGSRLVVM